LELSKRATGSPTDPIRGMVQISEVAALAKVRSTRLYEVVLQRLLESISSSQMSPGDKFLSEREVASSLGVSRGVLREAFRILESTGVVRSRPGGGRYLAKLPDVVMGAPNSAQAQVGSLLHVWEARFILEVGAMGLAVQNASDEELKKLVEFAQLLYSSPREFRERDYDLEFHTRLARTTHNPVIIDTIAHYMAVLKFMRQKLYMDAATWRLSCEQHIAIAYAVAARDEQLARSQMTIHLQGIKKAVVEYASASSSAQREGTRGGAHDV